MDTGSTLLRLSQWLHVVGGVFFLVPGAIVLRRHARIRGSSTIGLLAALGLLVGLVTGGVAAGLAATGDLGPKWLMPLHGVAALAFGVPSVVHALGVLKKRPKAKWTSRFAIPSLVAVAAALRRPLGLPGW